ncbi:helix-turn-helix transcriptional regulator [Flavobacterium sp.]|uniref:helix-turn-helix transcriptional regulator n=1 Tax=Flavobacterium sp. TaxID=239 RepID=UPI00391AF3F4
MNNLDLNFSERQILAYCLMGYTYKEIAQFTNSSFKSVESKKYRLKQKLERVNLLFILN